MRIDQAGHRGGVAGQADDRLTAFSPLDGRRRDGLDWQGLAHGVSSDRWSASGPYEAREPHDWRDAGEAAGSRCEFAPSFLPD